MSQALPAGASPYPARPARLESAQFLARFDKEAKDCHARVEVVLHERAVSGALGSCITAPYNLKCNYTQARLATIKAKQAARDAQAQPQPHLQ